MPLIEADIKKIIGATDWGSEDVKVLEGLLHYAGKDNTSDYEHFRLTQAIQSYKSGIASLKKIVDAYEERTGSKVDTKPKTTTAASTLKKVESGFKDGLVIDKDKLIPVIETVVKEYSDDAAKARIGVIGKLGFLTGKVCAAVGGKGDPREVQKLIGEHLAA